MVLPVLCNCTPCCDIGSDTFDRADNDSLGASWSERSGDADIVSNQLKFITAGLVRFETAHPDGTTGKQTVYADFKLDSTSSYARIVCSYTDDSNYLYASVEQVSSCWVLRLREVVGGATSSIEDDVPVPVSTGTSYEFRACWNPSTNTFSAVANGVKNLSTGATVADGAKVGLAGSANVIFDNFDFDKLEDESNPTCPDCAVPCFIDQDDFSGTSGSDLGCKWEEVSGSWEINGSGQLHKTSTGAGICRFKVPHPERTSAHYVEVDCILPNSAPNATQRHQVLVDYLDSSNYHYAELWINTSNTQLTLTIGKTGGSSTTVSRTATGGTYRLVVCYDPANTLLTASVQTTSWTLSANLSSTPENGEYVALAAGSGSTSGGELFDNFEFWKHYADNDDDQTCPDCEEFSTGDPTCPCCDPPGSALSSYTVDFGTATLIDNLCCDNCDQIAGEFVLQNEQCGWTYHDGRFCDGGAPCGTNCGWVMMTMTLTLAAASATTCRWELAIALVQVSLEIGACYRAMEARYVSDAFANTQCATVPRTLTLNSESTSGIGGAICSGDWQETVTLE